MRNQRALAAACAAVAALGFATPAALAEGRGDGGGPDHGISGSSNNRDHFNDSGNSDRDDDSGGRDGGGPRNIVAHPGVLPAGGRLAVTVDGCGDGTMSSRAFATTELDRRRDDSSRGTVQVDGDARPGRYDAAVDCDGRTLIRPAAFTVLGGVQGGAGSGRPTGATPADMAIGAGLVTLAVVGGGAGWVRRRMEKRS
ncbi:hypothetical protein ACIBJF_21495 [Streptomyces sp. NPDC050743]|uniref:hypothetical protein n=1 Tax=Streptomyces sp. NPDC050743 TaxID=3365634 RepID=UPI003789D912